ncbi:flagellar protein FlaG [Garciella nitratireducens]|uniref:Flagellar protein FlaG n=1 Tax=Garciella nitratireducens DSM 15102 TaxID=1121911 RepID=A0A1T4LEH0_9FIRM|nr:flagellar protein FlaG [Garciella nitratireducens]RBP46774.1 flagellar protein FlaG [Garciella nitratireducens]SJZ53135.1 flagellar protein FlaG [Garciella nitratireducens DSM 15102]
MRVEGIDQNLYNIGRSSYYIDEVVKNNLEEVPQKQVSTGEDFHNHQEKEEDSALLLGEKEILNAIESINENLKNFNRCIEFSIHEKTKDIMVKVVDAISGEVIREIPPKKLKDMVANILERAGLLIDERV